MRSEDVTAIRAVLSRQPRPTDVTLLSGETDEISLCEELWQMKPRVVPRSRWDLNNPRPPEICGDLVMVCNTFLCSKDPTLWLHSIGSGFNRILIQDLAVASRAPGRYLAEDDGDVMRFSVSSHGIIGKSDPGHQVYDLSRAGCRIIDCEMYAAEDWVKFVVMLSRQD